MRFDITLKKQGFEPTIDCEIPSSEIDCDAIKTEEDIQDIIEQYIEEWNEDPDNEYKKEDDDFFSGELRADDGTIILSASYQI